MKPWWDLASHLPQNLLAAPNEYDPENQRRDTTKLGEPLWNLGQTCRGTFWQPKTDLPEKTRDTTKLEEPWLNLGGALPRNPLAAQDGSAPENHRGSKSNSAPKPLLWLKTQKLIAVGEKCHTHVHHLEKQMVKFQSQVVSWGAIQWEVPIDCSGHIATLLQNNT